MANFQKISVDLGDRAYDVVIGSELLENAADFLGPMIHQNKVIIIADKNAWAAQGSAFLAGLNKGGIDHHLIEIEPGEKSKSFASLEQVCAALLALKVSRKDHLIAFGGGVVGDLVGFAAAITLRGMAFIQVPTTLLAQVDSSVGGKTAINHPLGKNMIGAFWQPDLVLADVGVLASLPMRDLKSGWAEVVKYGLINDGAFFDWCTQNAATALRLSPFEIGKAIAHSVSAKAAIVGADEREQGVRALLNLGHTFAHALESAAGYNEALLRHGEAVAAGMGLAAEYSARLGQLPCQVADNIIANLRHMGLMAGLTDLPAALIGRLNADQLLDAMDGDKKNENGAITLILMAGLGQSFVEKKVSRADLSAYLQDKVAQAQKAS